MEGWKNFKINMIAKWYKPKDNENQIFMSSISLLSETRIVSFKESTINELDNKRL